MSWIRTLGVAALAAVMGACAPQTAEPVSGASVGPDAPTEVLTIETAQGQVRFNVEIADDEAVPLGSRETGHIEAPVRAGKPGELCWACLVF